MQLSMYHPTRIFIAILLGHFLFINTAFGVGAPFITSDFPRIGGRTITLWDAQKGSVTRRIEGLEASGVTALTFSPDGKYLAGAVGSAVKIWYVEGGRLYRTLSGHDRPVTGLAFNADGSQLASCGMDNTVRLWNIDSSSAFRVIDGHTDAVSAVTFIPHSPWLASSSLDGTIRLTNLSTGGHQVLHNGASIQFLVYVSRSAQLLSGDYAGVLKLWDFQRGAAAREIGRHRGRILSLALHQEGLVCASSSWEDGLWLWDLSTGGRLRQVVDSAVTAVRFVHRGQSLALANQNGSARILERTSSRQQLVIGHSIASLAVTADERLLAAGEGPVVPEPRLFTILYGVSQYQKQTLTKALAAVPELEQLITQISKGSFLHVAVRTIIDETLNREALRALFLKAAEQAQPQDIFVFYFIGQVRSTAEPEGKLQDSYLVPPKMDIAADDRLTQQGVSMRELRSWLGLIPARNRMLILDGDISKTVALQAAQQLSGGDDSAKNAIGRNTRVLVMATDRERDAERRVGDSLKIVVPTLTGIIQAMPSDEITARGLSGAFEQTRSASFVSISEGEDFLLGSLPGRRTVLFRGAERINPIADRTFLRTGKDFALLIATDTYAGWGDLFNPKKDARAVGVELKDTYGFDVDDLDETDTVSIKTKLSSYWDKKFNKDDQMIIYLAGHGDFDEKAKMGYLVAQNSKSRSDDPTRETYLHFAVLLNHIDAIPCEHILIVIDTCYGGMLDEQLKRFLTTQNSAPLMRGEEAVEEGENEQPNPAFVTAKFGLKSRIILASTTDKLVSDGRAHSPFAAELLKVLKRRGGKDRMLTLSELKHGLEQMKPLPHFGNFGGDLGSDFLLFASPQ